MTETESCGLVHRYKTETETTENMKDAGNNYKQRTSQTSVSVFSSPSPGNTSGDDFDNFTNLLLDREEEHQTAGQHPDDPGLTVTMATAPPTTEQGGVTVPSAASLPVVVNPGLRAELH